MGGQGCGRKRKPTALKLLQGRDWHSPLPKDEPSFELGAPEPQPWLTLEARAAWNRIVPELVKTGVLAKIEFMALTALCVSWGNFVEAQKFIAQHGKCYEVGRIERKRKDGTKETISGVLRLHPQVRIAQMEDENIKKFSCEFGLTGASRSKVVAKPGKGRSGNPFAKHG